MKGFDLEKHLKDEGLTDQAFSLDDQLVKNWIANPSTYPEEFKGETVFLWKSTRASGRDRNVACLIWDVERVVVHWCWLVFDWNCTGPALLARPRRGGQVLSPLT